MHIRPVWCWLPCVRSVHGHAVSAVAVLLVCGRIGCLLVGSFGVGSLSLQRALAQLDLLRAGVLLVAVLVGASCAGPARYTFTVRRLPSAGDKSNDKWSDRCKKCFPDSVPLSLPRPGSVAYTTDNPAPTRPWCCSCACAAPRWSMGVYGGPYVVSPCSGGSRWCWIVWWSC